MTALLMYFFLHGGSLSKGNVHRYNIVFWHCFGTAMHWKVSILQLLLLSWKSCDDFVSLLWPLFCFIWTCDLRFAVDSAFAVQDKSGNLIKIFLYVFSLHYFLWHFFLFLRGCLIVYRSGLQLGGNTDWLYRMKQLEQKKNSCLTGLAFLE